MLFVCRNAVDPMRLEKEHAANERANQIALITGVSPLSRLSFRSACVGMTDFFVYFTSPKFTFNAVLY